MATSALIVTIVTAVFVLAELTARWWIRHRTGYFVFPPGLRIRHHPPYWMAWLVAIAIYANFFTHHYIPDLRWYLAALALGLYARTTVVFRPLDRDRTMPLLVAFLLIGFFIWLAENISTFFGIWRYPNQLGAWASVHVGKWSSWSLLVVMTFTIVANLKHIKERVHVPV